MNTKFKVGDRVKYGVCYCKVVYIEPSDTMTLYTIEFNNKSRTISTERTLELAPNYKGALG